MGGSALVFLILFCFISFLPMSINRAVEKASPFVGRGSQSHVTDACRENAEAETRRILSLFSVVNVVLSFFLTTDPE